MFGISKAILVLAMGMSISAHATGIAYYEEKKREFEQERDAKVKEASRLRMKYEAKREERDAIVKRAKRRIKEIGEAKGKKLQIELMELKETSNLVHQVYSDYLGEQKRLNALFGKLVQDFQSYHSTDKANRAKYLAYSNILRTTQKSDELAKAKLELENIYLLEGRYQSLFRLQAANLASNFRNEFRKFQSNTVKYRSFIAKYKFPVLEEPIESIQKLEQVITYSDSRYQEYRNQLKARFEEVSDRMEDLVRESIAEWKEGRGVEVRRHQESLRFINEIHDVIKRLKLAFGRTRPTALRFGEYLKGQFDVYTEILSYEDTCKDLKALNRENSPRYGGCALLKDLLVEAREFMKEGAWSRIDLALFNFYDAPPFLADAVARLQNMETKKLSENTSLVEAIKLHDKLLRMWDVAAEEKKQ